jgi:carboxypeptidase C (cathepsin A)
METKIHAQRPKLTTLGLTIRVTDGSAGRPHECSTTTQGDSMLRHHCCYRALALTLALGLLDFLAAAVAAADVPPLVSGDESIVVTAHQIKLPKGTLKYEARAGRLPIRNDESGEVRGYLFFVAYVEKTTGAPRPLTFIWNGGPTANSLLVHTEMFGPRRLEHGGFVDNAETLLAASDLVFMDPVGTGFSRPARPEYDREFLSTLGDFAATAEFIRAYRARFHAGRQPLFLAGESYGTWRVNGATEMLVGRGEKVRGAILISGGIPGSQMPFEFSDAMFIPARTAAAFFHHKLPPDLMKDREATLKAVTDWISATYLPALSHRDSLSDAEKMQIVAELARFTGVRPEQIDHNILVMSNRDYLHGLFDGDPGKVLNTFDMRITMRSTGTGREDDPARRGFIADYLRDELGYGSDLAYTGLEDGYMPSPGPARRSTSERWVYDHTDVTPELLARMQAGGGPPNSQPWLQNAMRIDHDLRVFVAAGRYDSLNMCEGNLRMAAKLEEDLSRRFTNRCYEGGHMMYRDQPTRLQLSDDIGRFVAQTASTDIEHR